MQPTLTSGADAASSILDLTGRTALLRLRRFTAATPGVEIYAKAEFQNPGGSVKDRAAVAIVREAERSDRLRPGGTILDATSGNTGIAYAMIGAARRYQVRLCVPANVTPERLRTLRVYGADVVLTSAMEGSDGAIREARRMHDEDPSRYFYADQYNNDANWRAHYESTGVEILEQTGGRMTHFVAGLGTTGTFVGVGRRLREHSPAIRLISVQPDSGLHGIEGLKHIETSIPPGIHDPGLADEDLRVTTEEAYAFTRRLAREEGLLVGVSSGAALAASVALASRIREGIIVTVFPDSGTRYLSDRFWEMEAAVPEALEDIRRHAADAYPDECCGALIASGGRIIEAYRLPNTTGAGARRRFLISPSDYRVSERRAKELQGTLAGFYHSHPDHPARPSEHDLEQAWPNLTYLIIAVRAGVPDEITSWRLRDDRSGFDQGEL